MKNDTNRFLMQGDIASAYGSINRLAVLKAVRKHIPCLALLCAFTVCGRWYFWGDSQERGENGRKCELHYSAVKGVWQGSTLSSAAFCLTFWSKMTEVMEQTNKERPAMGLISYADDFVVSSDGYEADRIWNETTGALGEIGLEIDQSKSCYTSKVKTAGKHKTLAFKKEIVVPGTEATEWNSMAADEEDASLAQKRLNEASEFAGHVEAGHTVALGLD